MLQPLRHCHLSADKRCAGPKLLKIASTFGKPMPDCTISNTASAARVRSLMVHPHLSSPRTPAFCRHSQVHHARRKRHHQASRLARCQDCKVEGEIPPSKTYASCPHRGRGLNSWDERELEELLGLAEVRASTCFRAVLGAVW